MKKPITPAGIVWLVDDIPMTAAEIVWLVDEIIAANPDKAEQAKGNPSLAGWFVGQSMKNARGRADLDAVTKHVYSRLLIGESELDRDS